mmetsp:Transcript_19999/g.32800  ORF Transcript_19999/g.32800 Transcript_19999/m.32800 type:complete len:193 (-) Transcript_19999:1598-2176(-)
MLSIRFHGYLVHDILRELGYEWYWRLDTDSRIMAPIHYDLFRFMEHNNKRYAYAIDDYDSEECTNGFWNATVNFLHSLGVADAAAALPPAYVSTSGPQGGTWNRLIVYNNFEIARLSFWEEARVQEYFRFIEESGNVFFRRWGDATFHTIAAYALHPWDQIHKFDDIYYAHQRRSSPQPDLHVHQVISAVHV